MLHLNCLLLVAMSTFGSSSTWSFQDEHRKKSWSNQKLQLNTASSTKVTLEDCPFPVSSGTITNCIFTPEITGTSKVVYMTSGDLTMIECTFQSCSSSSSGGVIYTTTTGSVTLRKCHSSNCRSGACAGTALFENGATIEECEFRSSSCSQVGGAMHTRKTAGLTTIKDSIFVDCSAENVNVNSLKYKTGAGAVGCAGGAVIVQRLSVSSCSTVGYGGVVACEPQYDGDLTIEDCVIEQCSCSHTGAVISFQKGNSRLLVSNLTCTECVGSGTIYVVAALDFQWEKLCILRCTSPVVISSINPPNEAGVLSGCVFTKTIDYDRAQKISVVYVTSLLYCLTESNIVVSL